MSHTSFIETLDTPLLACVQGFQELYSRNLGLFYNPSHSSFSYCAPYFPFLVSIFLHHKLVAIPYFIFFQQETFRRIWQGNSSIPHLITFHEVNFEVLLGPPRRNLGGMLKFKSRNSAFCPEDYILIVFETASAKFHRNSFIGEWIFKVYTVFLKNFHYFHDIAGRFRIIYIDLALTLGPMSSCNTQIF